MGVWLSLGGKESLLYEKIARLPRKNNTCPDINTYLRKPFENRKITGKTQQFWPIYYRNCNLFRVIPKK
jgi:hypothetical protein